MNRHEFLNKKTVCIGVAVTIAFALKLIYPASTTRDLGMFIQPTAEAISILNHEQFLQSADGFFFSGSNVVIDKSCSGFNFFIIAFCVFITIAPYRHLSGRQTLLVIPVVMMMTYVITVCVNTSRIVVAMFMLRLEPQLPWITEAWVHEAEGALVYLFSLLGAWLIVTHYLNKLDLHYAKRAQPVVAADH